jgi:hypothetical protein
MRKLRALALLSVTLLALGACDSSEDDASSIDGVWQSRGADVIYYEFNVGEGIFGVYDYYGDDYDDFGDCYVTSQRLSLSALGDDVYRIDGDEAEVTVSGDVLTVIDRFENGSTLTERLDRSDRRVSDFRPECVFSVSGPPQKSPLR